MNHPSHNILRKLPRVTNGRIHTLQETGYFLCGRGLADRPLPPSHIMRIERSALDKLRKGLELSP